MFFYKKNKGRNIAGVGVQLVFQVSQHIRDQELMKSFINYFKCGLYVNSEVITNVLNFPIFIVQLFHFLLSILFEVLNINIF